MFPEDGRRQGIAFKFGLGFAFSDVSTTADVGSFLPKVPEKIGQLHCTCDRP